MARDVLGGLEFVALAGGQKQLSIRCEDNPAAEMVGPGHFRLLAKDDLKALDAVVGQPSAPKCR
jgi:hypothetical protein